MGVKLNAYETMMIWDKFSSSAGDEQYESFIDAEADLILREALRAKPENIAVTKFSIDNLPVDISQ
jgi:hypothetical protein